MSADERIYIDDVTGKQIASPDDATNGGSVSLKGDQAKEWLKANPDKALPKAKPEEPAAEKAVARSENKEAPQGRNKAQKA